MMLSECARPSGGRGMEGQRFPRFALEVQRPPVLSKSPPAFDVDLQSLVCHELMP